MSTPKKCHTTLEQTGLRESLGYVAGAFTGASSKGMQGLLEQADGGTLFLDEVGDMPLPLQTRLLRVLAEGEVALLGASRRKTIDLQVVCASHRDLEGLVAAGEFREDLYFRLNGARFQLPPLRERNDRLALIKRILDEESSLCAEPMQLGGTALECLLGYRWPGNVRQLRHVLRYACAVCDSNLIHVSHLLEQLHGHSLNGPSSGDTNDCCANPERQTLLDALVRHRWKPTAAAKALGISRATLYRRVHQHGIEMPGRSQV